MLPSLSISSLLHLTSTTFLLLCLPAPHGATRRLRHLRPPPPPCSDYEMLIVNTHDCVARCPIRCIDGRCFEDGVCPCAGSYQTSFAQQALVCAADCLPGCKSAGGYCAAPDLCLCSKDGFYYDALARRCRKYHIFSDRCFGRCLYGTCNSNGECICAQGYARQESLFGQVCAPLCKQDCGRHGYCHLPNMCACRTKHFHYESDGKCHKDAIYLE